MKNKPTFVVAEYYRATEQSRYICDFFVDENMSHDTAIDLAVAEAEKYLRDKVVVAVIATTTHVKVYNPDGGEFLHQRTPKELTIGWALWINRKFKA